MNLLSTPYKTYKKLKEKYPVKTVRIEPDKFVTGAYLAFKNHRQYVEHLFKQIGVMITRWPHDYDSLEGTDPKLGVVFLASDSVIDEAYEAHVLIGHNAKYIQE